MWTRAELKRNAKAALFKNYLICVLAALVISLFASETSSSGNSSSDLRKTLDPYNQVSYEGIHYEDTVRMIPGVGSMIVPTHEESGLLRKYVYFAIVGLPQVILDRINIALPGMAFLGGLLFSIFVSNILEIGGCRFFLQNANSKAEFGDLIYGFKNGDYTNNVITMFKRILFIILWTLLLILPGIIKAYEYRMVPYILAENPEMDSSDVLDLSREMMEGEKWNAFVLDLSFILWHILSGLTLGLVGVFFVNPYVYQTNANLYIALKQKVAPVKDDNFDNYDNDERYREF